MKDFFASNSRKISKQVLGGIKQVVFLPKKVNLSCSNTIEKNNKKKSETTMEIEQNSFTKSDEQMKKEFFLLKKKKEKTNKGD